MAASDADKLKVATHFLLSSPPAQIAEVEKDVRVLLGRTMLSDDTAASVHSDYNAQQLVPIRLSATSASAGVLIASTEGRVDATHFVDSNASPPVIRGVDARAATCTDEAPVDASGRFEPSLEAHRVALVAALRNHVGNAYNVLGTGSCPWARGAEAYTTAGDAGSIRVVMSVVVRNLPNFWSGSWRVRATVSFPAGVAAGNATVSGAISIVTHYFEAANAQMHDEKTLAPVSVAFSDADAFARGVVKALGEAEDALHASLGEMYDAMSSQALKEMRRFLPVSGVKFNWNAAEHRMRRTLTTSSQAGGRGAAGSAAPAAGAAAT